MTSSKPALQALCRRVEQRTVRKIPIEPVGELSQLAGKISRAGKATRDMARASHPQRRGLVKVNPLTTISLFPRLSLPSHLERVPLLAPSHQTPSV